MTLTPGTDARHCEESHARCREEPAEKEEIIAEQVPKTREERAAYVVAALSPLLSCKETQMAISDCSP